MDKSSEVGRHTSSILWKLGSEMVTWVRKDAPLFVDRATRPSVLLEWRRGFWIEKEIAFLSIKSCTVELFSKKKKKKTMLIIYGARSPQCGHVAPGPFGESVAWLATHPPFLCWWEGASRLRVSLFWLMTLPRLRMSFWFVIKIIWDRGCEVGWEAQRRYCVQCQPRTQSLWVAPARGHKNARGGCRGHVQTELQQSRGRRGVPTAVAVLAGGSWLGNLRALARRDGDQGLESTWKQDAAAVTTTQNPWRPPQLKYRLKKYITH